MIVSRNTTIDVAKGIGIILVVGGHNWVVTHDKSEIFRIIFSFHVPLFFFLSGIFLKESSQLRSFLQSRTESLLKPYFVVLTILGILQLTVATLKRTVDERSASFLLGIIYGTGKTISWAPLWFLPHLAIASFCSLIAIKVVKQKSWLTFIATSLLLIGSHYINLFWQPSPINNVPIAINHLPGLPWSIDLLPITSAFIIFGYLLSNFVQKATFNLAGALTATGIFTLLHYYFNETMNLNERVYGHALISTLQATMGIYITISFAALIQKYPLLQKPLAYIGSGSLFLLIFHDTIQVNSFEIISKINGNQYFNALVSFAFGMIFPLMLWELVKRQQLLSKLFLPIK
jgi:polysaccharide biosynthesis protein PslL